MVPLSSSTSSSERNPGARSASSAIKALLFFVFFMVLFELFAWFALTNTPLRNTSLRNYFWYGESYEGKLRNLVHTPGLPPHSILHVGWINKEALRILQLPDHSDVTVYGSSFAGNVATAMEELRPGIPLRFVGAPGSPVNHTYSSYELDRASRKTRAGVIGVVSKDVTQVLTMNNGSLAPDIPMPFFFPRYDLVDGRIERSATPLVNSAAELALAIDSPALWPRQLAMLEAHDDAYRRFIFASDIFDHSAIARLLRRGLGKSHADRYLARIYTRAGYNRDAYAVQVFRGIVARMIADLREEGAQPIVILFATNGQEDHLHTLLADLLMEQKVPYLNSVAFCPSTDRTSYIPDGHFTPECNRKMAMAVLDVLDGVLGRGAR